MSKLRKALAEVLKENIKKNVGKTLIKDIEFDIDDYLPFEINGEDLCDMNFNDALKILKQNNILIKNNTVIIPKGLKLTNVEQLGGAVDYTFSNGLLVQLVFDDDEDSYFK